MNASKGATIELTGEEVDVTLRNLEDDVTTESDKHVAAVMAGVIKKIKRVLGKK